VKVFISHSSKDHDEIFALDRALRDNGIDTWLDDWEINPGDSFIGKINQGLETCEKGLIVFSEHTRGSKWVTAEGDALLYERIATEKVLIPLVTGEKAYVPPLFRPLVRLEIHDVERIVEALLTRRTAPPVKPARHLPCWGNAFPAGRALPARCAAQG
jgi:hypothetical protein